MNITPLFRPGGEFFLIAGPCVLEGEMQHAEIAKVLWKVQRELKIPVIFKASFDKANRAQPNAHRGPGIVHGLQMLADVQEEYNLPVLTDIHQPHQAVLAAEVCDVLQIPAFLCRQTDLLLAAVATGKPINLKKGQWMGEVETIGAVAKVRYAAHATRTNYPIAVTERGTFFGYGDLVVDMRNIARLQYPAHGHNRVPVIFDGTHSVQRPGHGADGASGGNRELVAPLVRAAVAAGASGLYLEVHPWPDKALSDQESMLPLDELLPLMREVMAIRQAIGR